MLRKGSMNEIRAVFNGQENQIWLHKSAANTFAPFYYVRTFVDIRQACTHRNIQYIKFHIYRVPFIPPFVVTAVFELFFSPII